MQSRNTYPDIRWRCAERLESRRLLSGAGEDEEADPGDGEGSEEVAKLVPVRSVEVVELSPSDEEEEEHEVSIDPSELPAEVREALYQAYPGAEILEVEMEEQDGEVEYDVVASFDDAGVLEIGISSEGEVLETSRILSESQLPPEILAWLKANFAGAEILEIEQVSEEGFTGYELQIAPPDSATVEATLRVNPAPSDSSAAPLEAAPLESSVDGARSDEVQPVQEVESEESVQALEARRLDEQLTVPQNDPSVGRAGLAAPGAPAGETPTAAEAEPPPAESERDDAAQAQEPAAILPQADLLVRGMRIDLSRVDAQLQQLLAEIDKLVEGVAGSESSGAARLALILALIAGAQVFRRDVRARRATHSITFPENDRDFSWALWSATTMRK